VVLVLALSIVAASGPPPAAASPAAAKSTAAAAATKRRTPQAAAGAGPVSRPLPAGAIANHGYPKGERPPVVPPGVKPAGPQRRLSAQEWTRVPRRLASGPTLEGNATLGAGATSTAGAVNLILRSGFDFNDTSLVLYFDAADPGISGWQSWEATVYDPATGAAQDSGQLSQADAK